MIKYTKTTFLSKVEMVPEGSPIGSVLWLHGLGADGHDFVSIVPELRLPIDLPLRFIFPHAPLRPVSINNGYVMRAWFDIIELSFDAQMDEMGIAQSVSYVHQWVKEEQQLGIPTHRIVLAGFSQGAAIALHAGLQYPERLGGILALSGALPLAEKVFKKSTPINAELPIFIAHGLYDTILPIQLGEKSASLLEAQGYPITFKQYDMAHSVCPSEIQDIAQWLSHRMRSIA